MEPVEASAEQEAAAIAQEGAADAPLEPLTDAEMYAEMARLGLRFTNARQTTMEGTPATLELMDEVDALLE
eukprot:25027-Prymnesium_polylepis.1